MHVFFCHRVDHLYTFFVQWSPDIYTKDSKNQGFIVVEDDRLAVIDNLLHKKSINKTWEVGCIYHLLCLSSFCLLQTVRDLI